MFEFEAFCLDTYRFLLTTWPWIRVSETVHRMLGHSADVIILNQNRGLLRIGEQGSESLHKVQRLGRVAGARKASLLLGDVDTLRLVYTSKILKLNTGWFFPLPAPPLIC